MLNLFTNLLLLILLILSGCAAREQLKEDNPVPAPVVQKEEPPAEALASFCTGFYHMIGRDWKTAAAFYEKALKGDPRSERILRYLISCYIQMNDNDRALVYMERLSDINRTDFTVHYTLASIHEEEGEADEAITEYERACRSNIGQVDKTLVANAFYRLAHLYLDKNEPLKAVSCFKDMLKLNAPVDPGSLYTEMGMSYIDAGDYEKALQVLEEAKELSPELPPTRLYLGIVYDELGRQDDAIAEAEALLQTSPDTWQAHAFLAGLYAKADRTGDSDSHRRKAISILQRRVAMNTSSTQEHITLARLLIAEDRKNEALRIMELAADKSKTREEKREVHLMLANMYYETHHAAQVEKQLREVLEIDPDSHEASNFLGYLFAERGVELDEALKLIEKALKAQPENGAYLDSLGWVYYKQATAGADDERMRLALEKLLEAIKITPDPEIYKHIGEIYYSTGDWKKARQQWEKALEEFPELKNNPDIKWITEQLKKLDTLQLEEERLYPEEDVAPAEDAT